MRKVIAALVVLTLAVGALAAGTLAASAGEEKAGEEKTANRFEFVLRFTGESRIDNDGSSSLTVGDTYVSLDEVFDAKGEQQVGRLAIDCVIIALPTPEDSTELSRCHGALLQNDSKLLLSTVTTGEELNGRKIHLAVVGGTGRYQSAAGEAVNDLTTDTSRLIVNLR